MPLNHGQIIKVPPSVLIPDPNQPRKTFPEAEIKAFGERLKASGGVQVPIMVKPLIDGKYPIKDGERRWRGATSAGLAEVPIMLAEETNTSAPDLKLFMDQCLLNDDRADLNAIDHARALARLRDEFGIKESEIPKVLDKAGSPLSRSYVVNLLRLLELPDWAQALIEQGKLTAAHGKYLLPALSSKEVTKQMQKHLTKGEIDLDNFTTKDMQEEVAFWYRDCHQDLAHQYSADAPKFNVKTECKDCPKRKTVTDGDGIKDDYCLDIKCLRAKNAKAEEKGKQKAKSSTENGSKKQAATPELTPAEKRAKNKKAREQLDNRITNYLEAWLRKHLANIVMGDTNLQMAMTVYVALDYPNAPAAELKKSTPFFRYGVSESSHRVRTLFNQTCKQTGIHDLTACLKLGPAAFMETALSCLEVINQDNVFALAEYCHVDLTQVYKVDEDFLNIYTKAGLLKLLESLGEMQKDSETIQGKPDLVNWLLSLTDQIGVPADLANVYAKRVSQETVKQK